MAEPSVIENASDQQIAIWLHERLGAALARSHAPIAITIPGGSTPFPILRSLIEMPLDWQRITVWPNDDRLVPEDHQASNTGRMRLLVEPAGGHVRSLLESDQVPHFALSWLGMGADGHVASLFPNTDPRADDHQPVRRVTPDPLPPDAPFDRITLTLPSLLRADELLFVIRGDEKRRVFEAAARGENDLPVARLLASARAPVTCFT